MARAPAAHAGSRAAPPPPWLIPPAGHTAGAWVWVMYCTQPEQGIGCTMVMLQHAEAESAHMVMLHLHTVHRDACGPSGPHGHKCRCSQHSPCEPRSQPPPCQHLALHGLAVQRGIFGAALPRRLRAAARRPGIQVCKQRPAAAGQLHGTKPRQQHRGGALGGPAGQAPPPAPPQLPTSSRALEYRRSPAGMRCSPARWRRTRCPVPADPA